MVMNAEALRAMDSIAARLPSGERRGPLPLLMGGLSQPTPSRVRSPHHCCSGQDHGETKSQIGQLSTKKATQPAHTGPAEAARELEDAFEALRATVEMPPPRERRENYWISDATWKLVDKRVTLRRQGQLGQVEGRRLRQQINQSLKRNRLARAELAGDNITAESAGGNVKEAYRHLKGWYRSASETAARPCYLTMTWQTAERVALYQQVSPPGTGIPVNIAPYAVAAPRPPTASCATECGRCPTAPQGAPP